MKKIITLICLLVISLQVFSQVRIGKTTMDYKLEYAGDSLIMNGAEMRSMYMVNVYTAALYLQEKSNDPIGIAYEDKTMALRLKVTSDAFTKEILFKEFKDGFKKATDKNTKNLDDRINKMKKYFSKELIKGDEIDFVYVKSQGVNCYKNGNKLGLVEGQDFKFALYKIWLGEDPVSKTLKKGMLGKL